MLSRSIYWYIIILGILSATACSQETEAPKSAEKQDADKVEINLENYIPKKPDLSPVSTVSDHPHNGTLKNKPKPSFPPRAEKSGHCIFILQVNEFGTVKTIEKLDCSDDVFTKHTKHKLLKWVFYPKKDENGKNTSFKIGPQKITYRLTDLDGNVVPE